MPNRYSGSAAVMGAFDRLCRVQRVLRNALALVRVEPAWLYHEDPWALFRQPAVSHPTVVDAPPPGVPLLRTMPQTAPAAPDLAQCLALMAPPLTLTDTGA